MNYISKFNNEWPTVEYSAMPKERYLIPHLGQRKLLIAEIAFLTKYNNIDTVLYVGAGKGYHLVELSELFPRKMFYLYDPNGFYRELEKFKNLITFAEYFTDEMAEYYGNKKKFPNILFISDIRSNEKDFETGVYNDLQSQFKWCNLIKPDMASLKFRLPHVNFKSVQFFSGKLKIQSWAKIESSETRLWTNCLEIINYDCTEYDQKMTYYNMNLRLGPYDIGQCESMDFCNDCAIEWATWLKYAKKFNKSINWCIDMVNNASNQKICVGPHCLLRDLPVEERIEKLHDQIISFYKFYNYREKNKNL